MNIATALVLPSWTIEVQAFINKTAFYTPIVWKAFNKTIKPVMIETLKGFSIYCYQSEQNARNWAMKTCGITHNPLQVAFNSAVSELTSVSARATYAQLKHIATERAIDIAIMGLCGVVAISEGIELAQKAYRLSKRVYGWVDGRLNPPLPEPTILPTVDLCLSQVSDEDLAALIDGLNDAASTTIQVKVDEATTEQPCDRAADTEACHPNGSSEYVAIVGEVWNPKPTDMHTEVQRMAKPANAKDELGAKGKGTRTSKAKGSTHNAGAKAKGKGVTAAKK